MNRYKSKNAIRDNATDRIFHFCNYTVFIVMSLVFAFPFYYVIINTVSNNQLSALGKILFYPIGFHLDNYRQIFLLPSLPRATFISVARTVLGTLLAVFGASYLGYLFTKRNMWHYKFWYRLVIATMYFSAGIIPEYLNIKALGLINTFWVYIIPGMFPVYNLVLVKTYMEQIPPFLEESAAIDGAGILKRYLLIMLPMSIPILATIAVFTAVAQWSNFMSTVLYITKSPLFTLQYILYRYFQEVESVARQIQAGENIENLENLISPIGIRLTITVIVTFPVMLVYPFMQRYFMKGIMIGAIKG
jgi:multiple sugar transport system permease protein/putative aldouronate transport system permease protein